MKKILPNFIFFRKKIDLSWIKCYDIYSAGLNPPLAVDVGPAFFMLFVSAGAMSGAFSFKQILGLSKFLDPLFQVRRGCKPRLPGLGGPKSG